MRKLELMGPCDFEFHGQGVPTGDETQRGCPACKHTVTNLSALTYDEAAKVLDQKGKRTCVRFLVDDDTQQIIFREPPREPMIGRISAHARPMVLVATLLAAACGSNDEHIKPETTATANEIALATETTAPPPVEPSAQLSPSALPLPETTSAAASCSAAPLAAGVPLPTKARPTPFAAHPVGKAPTAQPVVAKPARTTELRGDVAEF